MLAVIGLAVAMCVGILLVTDFLDKKEARNCRYRAAFRVGGYKEFRRNKGGLSYRELQERADVELKKLASDFLRACNEERMLKTSIAGRTLWEPKSLKKAFRDAEWKVRDRKNYFWKIHGLIRKEGFTVYTHARDYCRPVGGGGIYFWEF